MPPNIPADALPGDRRLLLAATLITHQSSSMLLFDADTQLHSDVLQQFSRAQAHYQAQTEAKGSKPLQPPATAVPQLTQIDSPTYFQRSSVGEGQPIGLLDDLPGLLPDLSGVDLVYIADPLLLAESMLRSVQTSAATPAEIRNLALRVLANFRDRVRGPVYASIKMQSADSTAEVSACLSRSDFFALGFVASGEIAGAVDTGAMRLYRYTLRDYKSVPGWLNSKYWAHPERWNVSD